MTDRTSDRIEMAPNAGLKRVMLRSGTVLCGTTDTLTMDLSDFGIERILSVDTYIHTTDYSVIILEAATTSVATDTLTVQPLSADETHENKRRIVLVTGE